MSGKRFKIQTKMLAAILGILILASSAYTVLGYRIRKSDLISKVDSKLLTATQLKREMIGHDYHDRITGPDSISKKEFDQIVAQNDSLCIKLGLEYLWSLMILDGKTVFTSATHFDKRDPTSACATFLEVHSNPQAYAKAFETMETQYSTFHDKWGQGRMAIIPARDKLGRKYLFAASIKLSELNAMLRRTIFESVILGAIIALLGGIASYFIAKSLSAPIVSLTKAAESLSDGDLDTEITTSKASCELATLSKSFIKMRDAIRQQMKSLQSSEENLAITLHSIGDAVIATDIDGKITRMNPVAEELTGWSVQEAVSKPLLEVFNIINAETRLPIPNPIDIIMQSGDIYVLADDTILIQKDQTEIRVADSGAPIFNSEKQIVGVVLVFRDVTEEHKLQDQLRQAQKMEAIGQLSGGIAHDFNNILTAIQGNAELLNQAIAPDTPQSQSVNQIITASDRATNLVKQLLSFARKSQFDHTQINVHEIIEQVILLLSRSIDKRIEIKQNLVADKEIIIGDMSLLENALLNLGINARDAMKEGGTLTFTTKNIHLNEEFCRRYPYEVIPGEFIEIDVEDTGIGINKRTLSRIFEPFFTTKAKSGGTGLGLSGVYGCVKSHNGSIHVYSEEGKGSTFKLYLPVCKNEVIKSAEEPIEKLPQKGQGHILIVDDEDIVRNFASRALENIGFKVSTCCDGLGAIDFYESHGKDIDLVILDLIMPKISGTETFKRLKKINPEVKVIFASGFSQDQTANKLIEEGGLGFVGKPFRLNELYRAVAQSIN